MVTRLSGTPLFAKLRLKKLIKAASGGLFYARQRVTTEGKAMAIDATLKVKQINSINPYGDGWNRHMEIDIDSIELVECVKPEEIISEYTAASLLDAMDESDVVRWLENEGYTVTND